MSLRIESSHQDPKVRAQLHGAGLHLTSNRLSILDVFLAGTEQVTITDLWLRTKKADPRTSHSAVWRLLKALVECGMAHRKISPADGILRYAPVKAECTHERVACKDCGAEVANDCAGKSPGGGPYEICRADREGIEKRERAGRF
jgi:Fur family transcriptional regulator, ferric uptake regulator